MHSSRRVPPAHKDEKTYEQIEQANGAEVVFRGEGFFCRSRHERCFELFPVAKEFVMNLRPEPDMIQMPGHLRGPGYGSAIECQQDVAGMYRGVASRRIGRYMSRLYAMIRINPSYPVVHLLVAGSLVEIQEGKNHRRQRSERQHHRPETDPQVLLHDCKEIGMQIPESGSKRISTVWKINLLPTPTSSIAYVTDVQKDPVSSSFWEGRYSF